MKALIYTAPNVLEYRDVPEPRLENNEALVKVRAVGVCGSDVHGFTGSTGRRIPPLIMGHEIAGEVAEIGSQVENLKPGDRVVVEPLVYCGKCVHCRNADHHLCLERIVLGASLPSGTLPGGFAEYVAVHETMLFPLPDSVSYEEATLIDPLAVAAHGVNRTNIRLNDVVAVVGAGTIGLFVLQCAHLAGAGVVVITDMRDFRLDLARELGASEIVNIERDDPVERVKKLTAGIGADAVIEAVGVTASFQQAMALVKTGGSLTLIGNSERMVQINMQDLVTRELNVRGSYFNRGEFVDCIDLLASGRVNVRSLISELLPLSEGQKAFDALAAGEKDLLKVILIP